MVLELGRTKIPCVDGWVGHVWREVGALTIRDSNFQSYDVLGPRATAASSVLLPASRHPGRKFIAESLNNDVSLDGLLASSRISLFWLLGQPGLLSATCRHLRSSRTAAARLVIQGLFVPSCSSCLPP